MKERGEETSYETVLADVEARDARDRDRDVAPMSAADDAILVDTSDMSIQEAVAAAIGFVDAKR